jgi:serine/threonine protein kinase
MVKEIQNQTEWQHFLGRRVSQHNFHEHFVPVRKLMQGTFASVYLVRRISDNKLFAAKAFSKELTYAKAFGKVHSTPLRKPL